MIKLAADEQVELERHKHWFIVAAEISGYVVAFIVPFIAYAWIAGTEVLVGERTFMLLLETPLVLFIASLWALVIWMRIAGIWTDYYLDVWTITNKRIIDIEQKGFFHRETSVFVIERVQDVTIETRGIIATLLNFGDIHVQTAGESQEFIMHGIANPKYVREVILRQLDRATGTQRRVSQDAVA